jgi:hypothetical protein
MAFWGIVWRGTFKNFIKKALQSGGPVAVLVNNFTCGYSEKMILAVEYR